MQPLRHITMDRIDLVVKKFARRKDSHPCKKLILAIGVDDNGNVICIKPNAPPRAYSRYINKNINLELEDGSHRRIGEHAEERVIKKCSKHISKIYILQILEDIYGNVVAIPMMPCDKCKKIAKKYGIKLIPLILQKEKLWTIKEKKLLNKQ